MNDATQTAGAPATDDQSWRGLLWPGYLTAWLFPIVGFIIGAIVIARRGGRPGTGHGIAMMLLAICFTIAYVAYLTSTGDDGGAASTTQDYQLVPCATHPEALGC